MTRRSRCVLVTTLCCMLALATSASAEGSYADSVLNRPLPRDNDERIRECNWIRAEMVRQQNILALARTTLTNPLAVLQVQVVAQQNVAALEARAAKFNARPRSAVHRCRRVLQAASINVLLGVSNILIARRNNASTRATND